MAEPARTWAHALARWMIRPLVGTAVTPNHLTTARLLTGLTAAALLALGTVPAAHLAGTIWVLSCLLDRADGELARLGGRTTPGGHVYDLVSDGVANTAVFIGIGIGLAGPLGAWAIALGLLAGAGVATAFVLTVVVEARSGASAVSGAGGFDPDDAMFVIAPAAWLGLLTPLLAAAAIGAPLFALGLAFAHRRLLLRGAR